MNLTDKEILVLNELCNAVVDGTISEAQKIRLLQQLATSEGARQFYVRALGLSASLYDYASEMQTEAVDGAATRRKIIPVAFQWVISSLAAAAVIVLALHIFKPSKPQILPTTAKVKADESVAQLTGSKECKWVHTSGTVQPGDHLRKGQKLELASGFAEITFDSGAQVVLEGPASFEVNSAWNATLHRGTLKANVPREASGFRISDPAVEVVDLGTEFTMISDASGAADVLVLKGMVEASPRAAADQRTILLRENQSRHFASSGVSKVRDSEQKFARYTQPLALDHFFPATEYVHWSFDETEGKLLKADAFGTAISAFDAQLEDISVTALNTLHSEGRWQHALQFNGRHFARASFPGISKSSPRTVAFWVKVPDDAQLSSAYSMVAWRMNSKKLGSHPVHVGWNRNPTEGTVGVLRTDYGGGFAMGATPLRDGRWHHVTVVFVPGEDDQTAVEVKQYVDGRLEGEGKPSPPGSDVFKFTEDTRNMSNAVWFGCRLGSNGPRKDRFLGEIDELCIANRALGPREIVQLMKDNKPPQPELVAIGKKD